MALPCASALGSSFAVLALASTMAVARAEEAVHVSKANVGISVMLLGSIGFMMSLFYLTNLKDKELRKYSWQVISATISIFSAVLLFQAVNGVVEYLLLEGASETFELVVAVFHMLAWFGILQLALGVISGALDNGGEFSEDALTKMELNLKCYAVLLGQITGFAAINAFAVLQQQLPQDFMCCLLVAPFAWGCIYALSRSTDGFRTAAALSDDGRIDIKEEKWDEASEETEDDVTGLCVSFVTVQAFRLLIGGSLPNAEGEEPEEEIAGHSDGQVALLLLTGFVFELLNTLRTLYIKSTHDRLTPQMRNITAMVFSWCLFFASDWGLSSHFFVTEHGQIKSVVLAMFTTTVSLALIFILDKVEDMQGTDAKLDNAIRAIILALSILIGFSWEKAFDTAVAEITTKVTLFPHPVTKMALAILLALTVIPAWKMHILPTILAYEEAEKEEEEGEADQEKAGEAAAPGSSLEKPLLEETPRKRSPRKTASTIGLSAAEIERRYQQQTALIEELKPKASECEDLKRRNAELEASIAGISAELSELQKLADVLAR